MLKISHLKNKSGIDALILKIQAVKDFLEEYPEASKYKEEMIEFLRDNEAMDGDPSPEVLKVAFRIVKGE